MFEQEKQKWDKLKTVRDFFEFIEDPEVDATGYFMKLCDLKKRSSWVSARIDFDYDATEILKGEPQIRANEISNTTRTPYEIKNHHQKYGFTNGYERYKINDVMIKIVEALGFEEGYSAYVNNQPPGIMMYRHCDFGMCYQYEQIARAQADKGAKLKEHGGALKENENILDMEFDKELRQPKGLKPLWRCLVALDDWHEGQILNWEPGLWKNFKKGDVLFWDFRHTPHSTANTGVHDRPLLKITGTIKDDSYILEARDKNIINNIKI